MFGMTLSHGLLIGLAVIVGGLIWWVQARRTAEESRRRRPGVKEPPLFSNSTPITPDHHLADQYLVDVEISPVERRNSPAVDPTQRDLNTELEPELRLDAESAGRFASELAFSPAPEPPMPAADTAAERTLTVALTVLAPAGQDFTGPTIQTAAEELELHLGGHGVFERFCGQPSADTVPVFSMAHLRKPGAFDSTRLAQLTTPGLLLFMTLPGPMEGSEALDLLVISADHLARNLGGHLGDAAHQRMTNAKLLHLREQVAEFERRWLAAVGDD